MDRSQTSSNLRYKIESDNSTAIFYMNPAGAYSGQFPHFSQPKEIGTMSSEKRVKYLTENNLETHKMTDKDENKINTYGVKYLVLPKAFPNCNFDLKIGFPQFVEHVPHQTGIDAILKWIIKNKNKLCLPNTSKLNADFICWRGLLTKLLSTPYEKQSDWMFTVIYYKKVYYLCELETEKQYNERVNCPDKLKQFSYWGHKFETYITSDTENGDPDYNSVPDPENNYGTVVRSCLGTHPILYAAEIDCCFNSEHNSLENYCEIKTTRGASMNDVDFSRNLKYMKWWLQSFLVNIKHFLIGLRDDHGIVKKLVKYDVSKVYQKAQSWNASACFNFLKTLLDFIKIFCVEENRTYMFERQSNSQVITCRKVSERNYYFLRDWYTREV